MPEKLLRFKSYFLRDVLPHLSLVPAYVRQRHNIKAVPRPDPLSRIPHGWENKVTVSPADTHEERVLDAAEGGSGWVCYGAAAVDTVEGVEADELVGCEVAEGVFGGAVGEGVMDLGE